MKRRELSDRRDLTGRDPITVEGGKIGSPPSSPTLRELRLEKRYGLRDKKHASTPSTGRSGQDAPQIPSVRPATKSFSTVPEGLASLLPENRNRGNK